MAENKSHKPQGVMISEKEELRSEKLKLPDMNLCGHL